SRGSFSSERRRIAGRPIRTLAATCALSLQWLSTLSERLGKPSRDTDCAASPSRDNPKADLGIRSRRSLAAAVWILLFDKSHPDHDGTIDQICPSQTHRRQDGVHDPTPP